MSQNQEGQSRSGEAVAQRVILYVVIIAAALVAGYYLSVALIPTPKIGVINLNTQVSGLLAETMAREIDYAIEADDIKAIVLVVNSPGGGAASGQDIYLQMRRLRDAKPVVASMDGLAASAAYQIAIASTEIYAKPATLVGSIGVITGLPQPETLSERFITTGPFKASLTSPTSWLQKLDILHADFRDSVVAERGDKLTLTPNNVATGEVWVGAEAKEFGLIDELGSFLDAVDRAAELAGVENYELVEVRDEYLRSLRDEGLLFSAQERYKELEAQPEIDLATEQSKWPTLYELYIPLE